MAGEAGDPLFVSGQLFDAQGNAVAGRDVEFRWGNQQRRLKTDADGQVRLELSKDNIKNLSLDVPAGLKAALVLADEEGHPFALDLPASFERHQGQERRRQARAGREGRNHRQGAARQAAQGPRQGPQERCFRKVRTLKLIAGATYTIDLESTDFDCYLRLEDPSGKQVAEDDDSGGRLNSRIVYTPETDGIYRIIITTCDPDQTGSYRLSVYQKDSKKERASRDGDGLGGVADGSPK